jgi:hypothetical protein
MKKFSLLQQFKAITAFAVLLGCTLPCTAQETISWQSGTSSSGRLGDWSNGVATALPTGTGNSIAYTGSPLTLFTSGPWANGPAKKTTFTFTKKVIITDLFITDINFANVGSGTPYNDSFTLNNVSFNSVSVPCATTGGVNVGSANYCSDVHWLCSNPLQSFYIDYVGFSGLSTAYLWYTFNIIDLPEIGPLCLESLPPPFPPVGNNIPGTWSPATISTSTLGNFNYTFTPSGGQALTCPFTITVAVVQNCTPACVPSLALGSPLQDVATGGSDLRQASQNITASNKLSIGSIESYHAGQYIVLTNGFTAENGVRMKAYIDVCNSGYEARMANTESANTELKPAEEKDWLVVAPNPARNVVALQSRANMSKVLLTKLDGSRIMEKSGDGQTQMELDISTLNPGIYVITVQTEEGLIKTQKLIKN